MRADIYVAVGSNIEPEKNIPAAVRRLRGLTDLCAVSTFYRTRPLRRPEQQDYRNGVLWIQATLEREDIERDLLKAIEAELGRVRTSDKHAARPIDLDLVVYSRNGLAYWTDPEVLRRNFIAVPLAELAPDLQLQPGVSASHNAETLGCDGLIIDAELTRRLKERERDESNTR